MSLLSSPWRAEAFALGRIAIAVTLTLLAQLALGTVETLFVARLGTTVLAGVSLAFGLQLLVFLAALGTVTAVTPLAAAAMGRGDPEEACRVGQAGLALSLVVSIPGAVLLLGLAALLGAVLPDGPEAHSATGYLIGTAPGLPAWVAFVALRCLAVATDTVRVTTLAMLATVPVHAGLVAWFTLGGFGLPPLGALGAGLADAGAGYAAVAALAVAARFRPGSVMAVVFGTRPRWDRERQRALRRLGLPFACRILLREGVTPAATLLLAPFGAEVLASHAVAARLAGLLGVVAFGVSDAANARVGRAFGAGSAGQVALVAGVALWLAVLLGGVVALVALFLPASVVSALLGPAGPDIAGAVLALLPAVAAFLFLEIVMSAAGGALSGLQDATGPLLITVGGAWLVGLPLGRVLAAGAMPPALGLWCGLVVGTALTTLTLMWRLRGRTRAV